MARRQRGAAACDDEFTNRLGHMIINDGSVVAYIDKLARPVLLKSLTVPEPMVFASARDMACSVKELG
ncbi:hypothetical protein E2562_019966 [Oryza meyeriana var. granulata]|uniref:Uncharacterized protein n=1 Tax=Oryza meyeriana var. granulata TaxID=110450 RepID=A0A6G1CH04_9ORYZ|nr:hypothetical protein E2562_019966 [Oryza meyeriana var. granulata]